MDKAHIYGVMHATSPDGLNLFQRVLALVIVASVVVAVTLSEPTVRAAVGEDLATAEMVFGVLFLLEYVVRVWSAGSQPGLQGLWGRLRYMRQPLSIIDLLAVVPFLVGFYGSETMVLRMIRLLRVLSLAKLTRYSNAMRLVAEAVSSRRFELGFTLVLALLLMLVTSTALYVVEGGHQPEAFGSIPRAAWWSITTLTTVGYGDAVPLTALGRFLAALTAFAGIGLFAMPAGILAASFSEAFQHARTRAATDGEARP